MKLTRNQRTEFFAGRFPKIAGEGKCPVDVGYVHRLSSRLSFEVKLIRRTRFGGWSLEYEVRDQRMDADRYLRPVAAPVAVDEKGRPLPMSQNEELGYTSNPKSRLGEQAPAVPADVQNELTLRARAKWSGYMEDERADELAEQRAKQLTRRLRRLQADAAKHGVDIAPQLLAMIQKAEQAVAKARAA